MVPVGRGATTFAQSLLVLPNAEVGQVGVDVVRGMEVLFGRSESLVVTLVHQAAKFKAICALSSLHGNLIQFEWTEQTERMANYATTHALRNGRSIRPRWARVRPGRLALNHSNSC